MLLAIGMIGTSETMNLGIRWALLQYYFLIYMVHLTTYTPGDMTISPNPSKIM
jgi:hypothetical protein